MGSSIEEIYSIKLPVLKSPIYMMFFVPIRIPEKINKISTKYGKKTGALKNILLNRNRE